MNDYVTVTVREPWDRVPVGEAVPLRFAVTLAADAPFAVTVPAGGVRHPTACVSTDLLLRDVTLSPGDTACVTVGARFDAPGPQDLRDFGVQVNPVGRTLQRAGAGRPAGARVPRGAVARRRAGPRRGARLRLRRRR